jgi:hypothetical protein
LAGEDGVGCHRKASAIPAALGEVGSRRPSRCPAEGGLEVVQRQDHNLICLLGPSELEQRDW